MSSDNPGEDWLATTIGEIAEVNPARPKLAGMRDDDTVGFIPMAAVDEVAGRVSVVEPRPLADVKGKSYRTFVPRDVLFAKITPCMENGKVAVAPDLPNACGFGSTEFHVLRPREGVDPAYLWRYLRRESYRAEAERHMTGSVGQLRVPPDFIRNTPILLPPLPEQQRISKALDVADFHRHAASDRLIQGRAAMASFRQAVLTAACAGRLTEDWRIDHPDATTVEEALVESAASRRKRKSKASEVVDLELPEVPATYLTTTVGDAAVLLEYGTSQKAEADRIGIPMLRMGNIQDGELDFADLKYCTDDTEVQHLLLEPGDLLFNRTNSPELVGKTAVFRAPETMTFASYLIRVRLHPAVAEPDFVSYWINSAWGKAWAYQVKTDGVSQSNINGTKLAGMPLPLPPIDEQQEIVRRARALLGSGLTILASIEEAEDALHSAAQALADKAFRGELSV